MTDGLTRHEEEVLLARPVQSLLTDADRRAFAGRRCLITGAGGSVGAELARQIASCRPAHLTVLDHGEHSLFSIERELRESHHDLALEAVLADVTRPSSIRAAVTRSRPDLVFHAAAYKHVTMAERAACAATRVNVLGTAELLTALRGTGARFVLVSSDKAAAPTSVMGATKRLAERITVAHADLGVSPLVVRFGNVLASSGSFVALMLDRMRQGKSLQLTHEDATRYFMSLSEAASLVMKAATIGAAGETLWLDMGEQVRMGDLADRIQELGVARGWSRVPVEHIGLRPGEKLVEQLVAEGVTESATMDPRIRVARTAQVARWRWEVTLRMLRSRVAIEDGRRVLQTLSGAVEGFEPSEQAWSTAGGWPAATATARPAQTVWPRSSDAAPAVRAADLRRRPRDGRVRAPEGVAGPTRAAGRTPQRPIGVPATPRCAPLPR